MCAIITTISSFIADFSSGRLDESSTHWVLIGIIAGAEVSLGVGIWIESPKNKSFLQWLGVALVLAGCIVSALFTVFLLIFDEGISRDQRAKIIVLETRIAPRTISAEQYDEIGKLRGKLSAVSVLASPDVEPTLFSAQLQEALYEAGVAINPIPAPPGNRWLGSQISLPKNDRSKDVALLKVLFDIGLNPISCSFDDPTLSIPEDVPRDVPLIIVGEREPFWPNGKPKSFRFRAYPGFKEKP